MKQKWVRPTYTKKEQDELKKLYAEAPKNFPPAVLEFLYIRGLKTSQEIEDFFDIDLDKLHDPSLMKDSDKLVFHLKKFIEEGKHIIVLGDYDADGVCATSIPVLALRHLGAKVDYFVNNRFIHGYGMNPKGIDDMLKKYPTAEVVLTVDNGIVAFEGVEYAKQKGLQVLVTDHHEPKATGEVPDALAVVNPKRLDCEYPFKGLCGAGVIWKMMLMLYWELEEDLEYIQEMMDIVSVATIGDVMPLLDENRILVHYGLNYVKNHNRKAFELLEKMAKPREINEETYGFLYVPMFNAVGRLDGVPDKAIDLFLTDDEEKMESLIEELLDTNRRRKELTAEQEQIGLELVEEKGIKPVIVLHDDEFHEGIVGLVAGRLKEKYNRPVIVLATHGDNVKGSARSIPNFPIKDAFDELQEYLLGYGGHDLAGGLGLEKGKLEAFEEAICKLAEGKLTDEDYESKIMIDSVLTPNDINIDLVNSLDACRPFGQAFTKPVFGLKDFSATKHQYMGDDEQHVKWLGCGISVIWFGNGETCREMGEPMRFKALGYPSLNVWRNNVTSQFQVMNKHLVASR